MNEKQIYFVTVDWCDKGKRGIFCDRQGRGFLKKIQHTEDEMFKILGNFAIILNPKSIAFTEEEVKQYKKWIPLPEYRNEFGIAVKEE